MSISVQAAVTAATKLAADLGLRCTDPAVLNDGSNVLVHLRPAPVVARVATLTALIRPATEEWLTRDIALATHVAARGVPATRPLVDPPAGPYRRGDAVIVFWEHLPHDPDHVPAPAEVAALLADLHVALRDFDADLPRRGPSDDLSRALDVLDRAATIEPRIVALLRAENARLAREIATMPAQPLHGDAHPGNLLATPDGLVWNDFEDTWRGPVGWDLACLASTGRLDGPAAVATYPALPPAAELAACLRLRKLFGVVWRWILVERFPDRAPDAREHLANWLSAMR